MASVFLGMCVIGIIFLLVENATVTVYFPEDGDSSRYDIMWIELLKLNQTPFSSYEEVLEAEKVMAPYSIPGTSGISYAEAIVIKKQGKCF